VTLVPWFSLVGLYEDNTRIGSPFGALGLEIHIGFLALFRPKCVFFQNSGPISRFSQK